MRRAGVTPVSGVIFLALACIVSVFVLIDRAEAQDNDTQDDNTCSQTVTVLDVDSSRTSTTRSFRTTQGPFAVRYTVRFESADADNRFVLTVRDGDRRVESRTETESGSDDFLALEDPGTFTVETTVRPQRGADYQIQIVECAEDDDSNPDDGQYSDDGDVDDADDVVPGTANDDPLPNTGGLPVTLGAAGLLLVAAALISRKILAP